MKTIGFSLDKIKFATDGPTFEKAIKLYEDGKVSQVEDSIGGYGVVVNGSKPYKVYIDVNKYGYGDCTCYLGQNDIFCKHMVALALHVVKKGASLDAEDKKQNLKPMCSGKLGKLGENELISIKKMISDALHYIKPYRGPSKMWFIYQDSLEEGCNRLSGVVSDMPVDVQTAGLLVELLLVLDRKLSRGGVDDSNGTVGGFIEDLVKVLEEFTLLDSNSVFSFAKLKNKDTSFGWEEPLVKLLDLKAQSAHAKSKYSGKIS